VLQYAAVCCSVLQRAVECVAVVLQCAIEGVLECRSVLQCVAVCYSVFWSLLQCVAMCYSVL